MQVLRQNIQEYFNDLEFNEDLHQYAVGNSKIEISVSGLLKKYKHPVNWNNIIISVAKKRNVDPQVISDEWALAAKIGCDIGNKAHIFGENYAFDRTLKPTTGYEEAIVKFWNDLPPYIIPLSLEVRMYHKIYMFAGTADILLFNTKTNKIHIADYKTNKDLFKNFMGQKMIGPFKNLLCSSYNHYALQLSYYQLLLEQLPDIKVAGRTLVWIKPNGDYDMYDLDDYTKELNNELKLHGI